MKRPSDSYKKTLLLEKSDQLPSPRLVRAEAKQRGTFSQFRPVDTLNSNTINPNYLPSLPHPDRSKAPFLEPQYKKKFVSYHLRSLFAALVEVHLEKTSATLAVAHVNLSAKASKKLLNNKKPAATVYGTRLTNRFKDGMKWQQLNLIEQPNFFLVLEDSADGSLHTHIIISYHPDDEATIKQMLRKEADDSNNAVMVQTEYKLWLNAEPGSLEWELNELEIEHDKASGTSLCTYPVLGRNRHGKERFYRLMPVDAGSADYISKELEKPLQGTTGRQNDCPDNQNGRRLYSQERLLTTAAELYAETYDASDEFDQVFEDYTQHHEEQCNIDLDTLRTTLQAEIDDIHLAANGYDRLQE